MQRSPFSVIAPDEYNLTSRYGISQCVILFARAAGVITLNSALPTKQLVTAVAQAGQWELITKQTGARDLAR